MLRLHTCTRLKYPTPFLATTQRGFREDGEGNSEEGAREAAAVEESLRCKALPLLLPEASEPILNARLLLLELGSALFSSRRPIRWFH